MKNIFLKRLFILVIMLLASIGVKSERAVIRVWPSSGGSILYTFAEKPVISRVYRHSRPWGCELHIKTKNTELHFFEHIVKFTFEESNAINSTTSESYTPIVYVEDDCILFKNLQESDLIQVYNKKTKKIIPFASDNNGTIKIHLEHDTEYITKGEIGNFKIINKGH